MCEQRDAKRDVVKRKSGISRGFPMILSNSYAILSMEIYVECPLNVTVI